MKRTATKRGFHPSRHFCQRHFRTLHRPLPRLPRRDCCTATACWIGWSHCCSHACWTRCHGSPCWGKKNFLWVRNNRDHQKAIESYDFCQLKPHLFSRRKELRGYPLIRRVGAISLCKFMTAPLALRGGRWWEVPVTLVLTNVFWSQEPIVYDW